MANGEDSGTWGTITNTNWNLMEQAVTGVDTIVMANANYTLTNLNGVSDEARNIVLIAIGTTGGAGKQIIAPLVQKFYIVYNNTSDGYSINIGASTGSVITIPNGVTAQVYCDGSTGFYSAQTGSAGNFVVNGTLTATGIADTGSLSAGSLAVSGTTTLSGVSKAPTVSSSDNSTNIATTAFVQSKVGTLGTMSTQNSNSVAITGGSINGVTGTNSDLTVGNATNATTAASCSGNAATATTANNALAFNGKTKLGLGITGETWHDVTGSRSAGVTYTNTYAYPIQVIVAADGLNNYPIISVSSLGNFQIAGSGNVYGVPGNASVIIPPSGQYSVSNGSFTSWYELY